MPSVLDTGDSHSFSFSDVTPCEPVQTTEISSLNNSSPTFPSANVHPSTSNSGHSLALDGGSLPGSVPSSGSPFTSNSGSPPVASSGCPPAYIVCSPNSDTDYSPASSSSGIPDSGSPLLAWNGSQNTKYSMYLPHLKDDVKQVIGEQVLTSQRKLNQIQTQPLPPLVPLHQHP